MVNVRAAFLGSGAFALAMFLAACGSDRTASPSLRANVDGQVSAPASGSVSYYQAARLLEQASWGPTPAAIAEVQQLGVAGWVDRQLTLPPTVFNVPQFVINYDSNNQAQSGQANSWIQSRFFDAALGAEDQLRQRVSWALFNFLAVGGSPPAYAKYQYRLMLQRNALGSYKDLLRELTLSPTMGFFLNNDQNEASRPNENYARELMQLFSVGLVMLNPDGSTIRDARGAPVETYSQEDVKAATRALSGWGFDWVQGLPASNCCNFGRPMVPKTHQGAHDAGAKVLMGRTIPAGQSIQADLESLLDILVDHPNTAPFVARRLIQNMVTSDPSPAYLSRVSAVFVQTRGDLKAVVRAILLDPEARAGDNPAHRDPRVGKIKEPLLAHTMALRGMGCRMAVMNPHDPLWPIWPNQTPFEAPSVFGYFSPNHRTAETLMPAPEEKLLGGNELNRRFNGMHWELEMPAAFRSAGCEIDLIEAKVAEGDEALIAFVAERFMRGAMPPPVRLTLQNLLRSSALSYETPVRKFARVMGVALTSPYGGVVR
jgi:uncharacterized protein (DUF1800 family)